MSGDLLNRALRDAPIPEASDAEERGRRIVEAAYAERRRSERGGLENRWPWPRLVLPLGLATVIAALLLTPAGATVRDWVDEAISNGAPRPEPTLAKIPGGGKLLVQTGEGPWVVEPDGSRRLLGDYESASWSPHGLFVVAAKGRTMTAVEPDGTLRWSTTSGKRVAFPGRRIATPIWSPSGEQIAYRSGFDLRVIAGDGTEDRLLAGSIAADTPPDAMVSPAYVTPAWDPTGADALAYVTGAGRLRILDSETGAVLTAAPALDRITWLDWADEGRRILEASPGTLRLRPVLPAGNPTRPALGKSRRLPMPPGASVVDAALAPDRPLVAASVTHWKKHGTYSEILIFRPGRKPQSLLSVPGSLGQVLWSPNGRRVLAAWPGAGQWLFLPLDGGRGRAIANITRAFSPGGQPTSFPMIEGWCCRP